MIKSDLYQQAVYEVRLEDNFYEFVKEAWEYVDPSPFQDTFHTKVICEHLQAIADHKIDRLIINVPPGFGKSVITSVLYPAWIWLRMPAHQFLTGSHSYAFALRDARKCRDLISTDWYKYLWGAKTTLTADQNQKGYYENVSKGYRTAFGTGTGITGQRAHTIIFDDPNNIGDVYSKPKRDERNRIITEGLETRLHLVGFTAMIVIMQRLHVEDVTGHLLDTQKGWVHLRLPLLGDPQRKCKTPLFTDKRRKNQLLWKQFDKRKLERAKNTATFHAQYQQIPTVDSGEIFMAALFRYYKVKPPFTQIVQSWDTAYKEGQANDYSVCTTWGITKTHYYLLHVWRKKVNYIDLKRAVADLHSQFKVDLVLIEDKASGQSLIQEVQKNTRISYVAIKLPKLSKVERAYTVTPLFEAERVLFPETAAWLNEYKEEHLNFPVVKHDDQVDSSVNFLSWANKRKANPQFLKL